MSFGYAREAGRATRRAPVRGFENLSTSRNEICQARKRLWFGNLTLTEGRKVWTMKPPNRILSPAPPHFCSSHYVLTVELYVVHLPHVISQPFGDRRDISAPTWRDRGRAIAALLSAKLGRCVLIRKFSPSVRDGTTIRPEEQTGKVLTGTNEEAPALTCR